MNTNSQTKESTATVVGTYSRELDLLLDHGQLVRARIKGKQLKPVCGDLVICSPLPNEPQWLVTAIHERQNALERPNMRGKIEVLAANLQQMFVVSAPKPKTDWFIVDRYLAAAELMGAVAVVVFNKTDLAESVPKAIENYRTIGYEIVECSAKSGTGLQRIRDVLAGNTAIFTGQSGVGKSTLINALIGDETLRTGALSEVTGEGRHTTVNSALLRLPGGGRIIDSPGVRDYAPVIRDKTRVADGFREISSFGQNCRFANCQHDKEPECAVKAAVETREISQRRYDSFRRLVVSSEQLRRRRR